MNEISIIMPIYNAESTLNKTINSVVNQKFDKKYELILINDGSSDNSEKICLEFAEKYNFIKYKKVKNGGVSKARNIGLELSNSKYIMFLDSDDFLEENALSNMDFEICNSDSDLVIAGYNRVNENNNRVVSKTIQSSEYNKSSFGILVEKTQNNNLFNQLWNKIFKLDIIRKNKIEFDILLSFGEDYKFIITYLKYCKKVKIIDKIVYNYINNTSGLNTKYYKNRLQLNLSNLELLEEFYMQNNYNDLYLKKKYIKTCLSGINNICKNPKEKEKNALLKEFINDKNIHKKLNVARKNVSFKYKVLIFILNCK